MKAYCVSHSDPGFCHARLRGVTLVLLFSVIGSGCVTRPPSTVRIQAGRLAASCQNEFEQGASLRVTTFNVWGLPSWVNGASADRYRKIANDLAQLGSDVVLLQEVWTRRSFTEISDQALGSARSWWTASARRKGSFLGQNGLLTLSRYPITGAEVRHFGAANLPDSLMNKGALKVTITVGAGQQFNIWNVHLQDGASTRARSRQIAELIGWIQRAHDGQVADIVGGDFNFTPESSEFRQFVGSVGPDVHQMAGDSAFPTWDGLKSEAGGGQALDHIFVRLRQSADQIHALPRRVFTALRQQDRLSDHIGMEVLLTFERTTENRPTVLAGHLAQNTTSQ
jgi:endonuclease/exonuclease/phosphatase family metal-dependent hydrolase